MDPLNGIVDAADQSTPDTHHLINHHRGSDASDTSNHLTVSRLYDDDAQGRKSSISFDKIKQISLTYSLQSEDDSGEDGVGRGHLDDAGHDVVHQSSDSNSSGSSRSDCNESNRKVSVIDLKNSKQQHERPSQICDRISTSIEQSSTNYSLIDEEAAKVTAGELLHNQRGLIKPDRIGSQFDGESNLSAAALGAHYRSECPGLDQGSAREIYVNPFIGPTSNTNTDDDEEPTLSRNYSSRTNPFLQDNGLFVNNKNNSIIIDPGSRSQAASQGVNNNSSKVEFLRNTPDQEAFKFVGDSRIYNEICRNQRHQSHEDLYEKIDPFNGRPYDYNFVDDDIAIQRSATHASRYVEEHATSRRGSPIHRFPIKQQMVNWKPLGRQSASPLTSSERASYDGTQGLLSVHRNDSSRSVSNGSNNSIGLRLRQNGDSISLVMYNKPTNADTSVTISDHEPETTGSCSSKDSYPIADQDTHLLSLYQQGCCVDCLDDSLLNGRSNDGGSSGGNGQTLTKISSTVSSRRQLRDRNLVSDSRSLLHRRPPFDDMGMGSVGLIESYDSSGTTTEASSYPNTTRNHHRHQNREVVADEKCNRPRYSETADHDLTEDVNHEARLPMHAMVREHDERPWQVSGDGMVRYTSKPSVRDSGLHSHEGFIDESGYAVSGRRSAEPGSNCSTQLDSEQARTRQLVNQARMTSNFAKGSSEPQADHLRGKAPVDGRMNSLLKVKQTQVRPNLTEPAEGKSKTMTQKPISSEQQRHPPDYLNERFTLLSSFDVSAQRSRQGVSRSDTNQRDYQTEARNQHSSAQNSDANSTNDATSTGSILASSTNRQPASLRESQVATSASMIAAAAGATISSHQLGDQARTIDQQRIESTRYNLEQVSGLAYPALKTHPRKSAKTQAVSSSADYDISVDQNYGNTRRGRSLGRISPSNLAVARDQVGSDVASYITTEEEDDDEDEGRLLDLELNNCRQARGLDHRQHHTRQHYHRVSTPLQDDGRHIDIVISTPQRYAHRVSRASNSHRHFAKSQGPRAVQSRFAYDDGNEYFLENQRGFMRPRPSTSTGFAYLANQPVDSANRSSPSSVGSASQYQRQQSMATYKGSARELTAIHGEKLVELRGQKIEDTSRPVETQANFSCEANIANDYSLGKPPLSPSSVSGTISGATAAKTETVEPKSNQGQQQTRGAAEGSICKQDKDSKLAARAAATRPIKLKNLQTDEQTVDTLHCKYKSNNKSHGCNDNHCLGSLINPKPVEHKVRTVEETLEQAKDFINNYYASIKRLESPAHTARLKEIEDQLRATETYYLKETELIYGAKLAWRNAPRCIGRIQWSKLQVFDARFTTTAHEMFEALCNHIKYATNKGSLRSAITILPQRVKSTKNDWRVWNAQLIAYAGYRNKDTGAIIGDPINADFTEVCQRLGWKGKGTRFDVLPLVLQAAGSPPELFQIPEELIMRVPIRHPKFKWFEELQLEWYALPAVSGMMLDVGGLQFTATPFSGWYMVTEIGTRDLADSNRYNMLEPIAQRMGLNTTSNMSLWKDQALVELNIAVLDSFQSAGVTIVDHHTASETFMTHLANEQRLRGGCPADWVWLVPPTAGSTTQVYHQEMVSYHLLPNYEYQEPVWKNFDWAAYDSYKANELANEMDKRKQSLAIGADRSPSLSPSSRSMLAQNGAAQLTPRKLRFKEIARAVKFTSKLFGKALSRRIKATILYATETGKSERYANKLAQVFSRAFNVHLMSMSDYDLTCLEHEALLLVVTSTFGNGDPPENGALFAKHLAAVKITGDTSPDIDSINSVSSNPFFQMLSEDSKDVAETTRRRLHRHQSKATRSQSAPVADEDDDDEEEYEDDTAASRYTGIKRDQPAGSQLKQEQETNIKPLSNVRFGVFALGSTAYPHFCAFGRYVDQTLGELGAERIMKCHCGDELCGQEKAFNEWSNQIFKVACDVFCLTDSIGPIDDRADIVWSPKDVRFVPVQITNGGEPSSPEESTGGALNLAANFRDKNKIAVRRQQTPTGASTEKKAPGPSELLSSPKLVVRNLMNITNKKIVPFSIKDRVNLHDFCEQENLQTLRIDLQSDLISGPASLDSNKENTKGTPFSFEAGDHVAIYPINKAAMVDKIIERMRQDLEKTSDPRHANFDFDQVYSILVKRENMDLTPATAVATTQGSLGGQDNSWIAHDRLPITSMREALTRYVDITNPPNQEFLLILSRQTSDTEERKRLQLMGKNFTVYEDWKIKNIPCLLNVLEEFKTIKFDPALITQIPLMQPRFYSLSGITTSLTLGVVRFNTASGELREGLCSNYLNTVPIEPSTHIYGYIRSAPAFHMPQDTKIPMILVSAGTGIAPFRSFWQKRYADMYGGVHPPHLKNGSDGGNNCSFGRIELYFGCRNSKYTLYTDELDEMYKNGVLSSVNLAFSRPLDCDVIDENNNDTTNYAQSMNHTTTSELANQDKGSITARVRQHKRRVYVQDKLLEHSDSVFDLIMNCGAHIYVCGDVAMADGVYKTLGQIFNNKFKAQAAKEMMDCEPSSADSAIIADSASHATSAVVAEDGESVLMNLRNLNRYHEDIFGAKQAS